MTALSSGPDTPDPPKRIQLRRTKGWRKPEGAVVVSRPTKFGNRFRLNSRTSGLARVPAVHYPDKSWEFEGRISADGNRHDYHHPGGKITVCHVRYMTRAETVECYRAWINGGGWPIDWAPRLPFTLDEVREHLGGHDLACWCPLVDSSGARVPCHADVLLAVANGWPS